MLPSIVLAFAISLTPPEDPTAASAVLDVVTQWKAVSASPRIKLLTGGKGGGTGVTVAVRPAGGGNWEAYILTAYHVIAEPVDREVQFFTSPDKYPDWTRAYRDVKVLVRHPASDLALLRVMVGDKPVPFLPLAEPGERPKRFGFSGLSVGCSEKFRGPGTPTCRAEEIVGKYTRRWPNGGIGFFWELQTPPVPGRSGGPLLDDRGRVIGICAAAYAGRGYYTHLDEITAVLKQEKLGWLWQRNPNDPTLIGP